MYIDACLPKTKSFKAKSEIYQQNGGGLIVNGNIRGTFQILRLYAVSTGSL